MADQPLAIAEHASAEGKHPHADNGDTESHDRRTL